jgi:drug/metabolite transporter (DMT)-like permease
MNLAAGIVLGFSGAVCQSFSYIASRWFIRRGHGSTMDLLAAAHILMGAASLAILPFICSGPMPHFAAYGWYVAGAAGFYIAGQLALLLALHGNEASRMVPMLGLKILVLALLAAFLRTEQVSWLRWTAVGLSVAAALVLNEAGGRLSGRPLLLIMFAIVGYSLSDMNIARLVAALAPMGPSAAVLAACLTYMVCGLFALPVLIWHRPRDLRGWGRTIPYAASWYIAMILLYACFGLIGVVFGNIVQSTRGLLVVVLASAVAHAGFTDIEAKLSRKMFLRRIAAALLMTASIALYVLG